VLGAQRAALLDDVGLLQTALLAPVPAEAGDAQLSVAYRPAAGLAAGGDFYDVIALDDGRVVLFVGDVMGRGVKAAAAMAQMRAAVRAYLAIDPDPAVVMSKLDILFRQYDMAQLVTLVYGVVDPTRDELHLANAGHPPPVLLRVDGTREQLPDPDGVPLGVGGVGRSPIRVRFQAGDTLLAFTDGLIERREEDIDTGQKRLLGAVPSLRGTGGSLSVLLERLVEDVRDHTRSDDVAAVAVRRRG